jgi:Tol biopolymer transport system component
VIARLSAGIVVGTLLFMSLPGGGSSRTGAFPGKNGKLVFAAGIDLGTLDEQPTGFYTVNPRGKQLRQLLKWRPYGEGPTGVQWAPNGREIVFNGRCGITIATATGSHRRCIGAHGFDPTWSPGASRLVLEQNTPLNYTLQIVSRAGRVLTTIPIAVGFPSNLAWSPLGDRIAFDLASDSHAEPGIYAIRQDGTAIERLTTVGDDSQPNWSPDGRHILFVRHGYEVWVMDADGTNARKLLVVPRVRDAPDDATASAVWSPDGTKIALASPGARWMSIYALRTRTRRTIRLRLPRGVVVSWNERLDWQPLRR